MFTMKARYYVNTPLGSDSLRILKQEWESADDTSLVVYWNGDTSNVFMLDGYFNHANYAGNGGWLYEDIQAPLADSLGREYKLRFHTGLWKRFRIISTAVDSVKVYADIWAEH